MDALHTQPVAIEPPPEPLPFFRFLRTLVRNPLRTWPQPVYEEALFGTQGARGSALFVMAPALIRQVLLDDADAFTKGVMNQRALGPALGDAILTSDGARWRWQRRAAAPIFRHERIERLLPAMIAVASRTRDAWLELSPGTEIDVAHEMMRTTFAIILETMLPDAQAIDAGLIERAITDNLETVSWVIALTILGAPSWFPYPGVLKARRGRRHLREALDAVLARARGGGERDDLLSMLAHAQDPETGRTMRDTDLRDNLLTFITAGHETTAQALTWTFYLLSLHPGVEQQVRSEIARVAGADALRPEHLEALTLTKQVIAEAMRLYPPAALLVRQASRALSIGGEEVAPGTLVYVPIYAVHRHRAYWDMPDAFDPTRFAPEAVKVRDRYVYLPFGAGPRACIGMSFAQMEAAAVLAVLLPSVRLRLRPGYVPEPKLRVTLRPAKGMPMRIEHGRACD
jgi:cytochrome P450